MTKEEAFLLAFNEEMTEENEERYQGHFASLEGYGRDLCKINFNPVPGTFKDIAEFWEFFDARGYGRFALDNDSATGLIRYIEDETGGFFLFHR